MGQRKEKQYRQLERRVAKLEAAGTRQQFKNHGYLGGISTDTACDAFNKLSEVMDAPYRQNPEMPPRKTIWQRFVSIFRKGEQT